MRRAILIVCFALLSIGAYAQKGNFGAGIGAFYGTEISKIGGGAKLQYYFNDYVRGELGANLYAKNEDVSTWDLNLNFHYLANLAKHKFYLYPLVGVTMSFWKFDTLSDATSDILDSEVTYTEEDNKESRFGTNLGMGFQYNINDLTAIFIEGRYQMIGDFNQGVFGIGISRRF